MQESNIKKVFQATKDANAILTKAGGIMLKASINTTKQIASLYKDAGWKAFQTSKDLVKKTVELTVSNNKELIKTSGSALKEVTKSIFDSQSESKAGSNGKAKPTRKQKQHTKAKKEISIDDLL